MKQMTKKKKPAMKEPEKPVENPVTNQADPIVTAFVLCEYVAFDAGGVPSAIRIVDVVPLSANPMPSIGESVPLLDLQSLLIIKAGEARGKKTFRLRVTTPENPPVSHVLHTWDYTFAEPPESGATMRLTPLYVVWANNGVYYLEAEMDGRVLARLPFKLTVTPRAEQTGEQSTQQSL
jgi:hypothetical protein